jgi:hypothetical protein
MPIVSVNLSPKAYVIYNYLSKGRRASRILSTLLVNWDAMYTEEKADLKSCGPMLEPGDRRVMSNGDICAWSDEGWVIVE